ncbi:type 2 periplasmic-binding domain-containing protein [Anaerocolumna xylanovorans]|uniref:Multiple sugar transport system substrate-binding protein n=1 Tax=Anaerocolumna xylanovorans DSM 12503 TaxID=1121345 RepID=A0A1M7Y5A6_9FIRM|nr:extracellular solute-binding protein [Anaerocolumna xylanovorans]SHO47616.1 multiple sugar transport system substrate-binding protein [Anaerocolumna xylanovorans DSM 12503]
MKKNLQKLIACGLVTAMFAGVLTGCGSSNKNNTAETNKQDNSATATATPGEKDGDTGSAKPFEGVKLKYATTQTASTGEENQKLIQLVKDETGIDIEFFVIPNSDSGEVDKTLVSLMNGDEIDIIYNTKPGLKTFYNAGVLTDLSELAKTESYDMASKFGDYLPVFDDAVYGLPAFSDIWITLYNKKIFDDAGVAYPSAKDWTWEKYVETAKSLTNTDKGIYGSLMLDYDCYNYMYALQKGWNPYKADNTANFDDPLFKESLNFYYGLGNNDKIQPSILDFKASGTAWNAFFTTGQYGMFVCGGWTTSVLNNFEKYPRDWKVGLLPLPYPEGQEASTLTVPGCYAIPTTSKNKEAAFAAVKCMAENQYKLGFGRVPARVDLSNDEVNEYIENSLAKPFAFDELTVDDFKTAWFDPTRKALSEKIIGPGSSVISQVVIEEGQLYGQGGEDVDAAIKNIQNKANAAIESDK